MQTLQTINPVTLATRGRLIGTTDMQRARDIGKLFTVADLIGSRPGYFERVDNNICIWIGSELYEMGPA